MSALSFSDKEARFHCSEMQVGKCPHKVTSMCSIADMGEILCQLQLRDFLCSWLILSNITPDEYSQILHMVVTNSVFLSSLAEIVSLGWCEGSAYWVQPSQRHPQLSARQTRPVHRQWRKWRPQSSYNLSCEGIFARHPVWAQGCLRQLFLRSGVVPCGCLSQEQGVTVT